MNSYRKKLIASGLFLVLAVVTLVGASVAWFTISTRPEIGGLQVSLYANKALLISDSIDGEYGQLLDMDDQLSKYVELRPVSTADGVNWFLPTYEASGPLKDPSEFILDDDLTHANILSCAQDGTPLEGAALIAAREKGFYVYTEFYMKTEEDQCDVRLSIPASTSLESWETAQGTYGTYALASYDLDGQNLAVMDSQSQTALRVGFLTDMGTPSQRFVIYEPNADERSASGKPESTEEDSAERYVVGYDKSNTNYL
ncbi:MAG: hypothetical protein EOM93_07550, partial [Gammaproteobacteria bacterium]|nr:hypothetical protein [Gammaproteobacteria bacterium]